MKALTLWQPHATLVALADQRRYPGAICKRIETRSWGTSYRGPLLIHAAQKWDREVALTFISEPISITLAAAGITQVEHMPFGAVVASARLVEVFQMDADYCEMMREHYRDEYAFGLYKPGRYAWLLEDVIALPEPIPCKGGQRLWNPPADVVVRVEEILAARR